MIGLDIIIVLAYGSVFLKILCSTLSLAVASIANPIYFLWQKSPFKSLIYLLAHEDAGVVVVVVVVVVTVVVVVGGRVVVIVVVVDMDVVDMVVVMVVVVFSPTLPPPSESGFLSSEQKWSQVFKIIVLEVSDDDMRMKVCFLKHLAKAKKTANNRHQHKKQQKSSGAFQEQM